MLHAPHLRLLTRRLAVLLLAAASIEHLARRRQQLLLPAVVLRRVDPLTAAQIRHIHAPLHPCQYDSQLLRRRPLPTLVLTHDSFLLGLANCPTPGGISR